MEMVKLWTTRILLWSMLLATCHHYAHFFLESSPTHQHDHSAHTQDEQVAHDCAICLFLVHQQVDIQPTFGHDLAPLSMLIVLSQSIPTEKRPAEGYFSLKGNKDPPFLYGMYYSPA